jgi:hypothetical protein
MPKQREPILTLEYLFSVCDETEQGRWTDEISLGTMYERLRVAQLVESYVHRYAETQHPVAGDFKELLEKIVQGTRVDGEEDD